MPRGVKKQAENIQDESNTVLLKEEKIDKKEKNKEIKSLPNHVEIIVKSNMFGKLLFINEKNGNRIIWRGLDETENLTVEDIKYMKSNQPSFFEKNWIKLIGIADEEYENISIEQLYKLLGINKFYKIKQFTDEFKKFIKLDAYNLSNKIEEMSKNERILFKNYVLNLKKPYIQELPYGVIKTLNDKLELNL